MTDSLKANEVRDAEAKTHANKQWGPPSAWNDGHKFAKQDFATGWDAALAKDPRVVALREAAEHLLAQFVFNQMLAEKVGRRAVNLDYDKLIALADAAKAFEGGGG